MCKILMPIKPKFTKAIFNQEKTYELRRQIPKRQVKQILIYETAPSSKVVGIITVKKTYSLLITKLWNLTKQRSFLNKNDFLDYFKDKKIGHAYQIEKVVKFKRKQPLSKYNINFAPQGFVYLD